MKSEFDFSKTPVKEIYGCNCFNDSVMRERLPKSVFNQIQAVRLGKKDLAIDVAEAVAASMKAWAIEKGATHFCHWFQPLTGYTAEKHDSFITPTQDGRVIMEFSGKELTKGEPDASSFPSGGLRATFEARGYTAWDTSSPAFVKEDGNGITLYIPTAFLSHTGVALDKKTPLLRSGVALNQAALRILKLFGAPAEHVFATAGAEQEYFLIDQALAKKRPDLLLAGRTLFGSQAPKGQEMNDHYFGAITERAAAFMKELNYELWCLGIASKTQHKEVAPNQFEIATVYSQAAQACDQNHLVMLTIDKVARRHGMTALLHEKPFAELNGSGKHNNWSMATDSGLNLLEPGDTPWKNSQFLVFLLAFVRAVDLYAPLLRASVASSGNDHRLGGHEAPPAVISIFLGDMLSDILEKLSKGEKQTFKKNEFIEMGVNALARLPKEITDRNRTSPLAFTGNKFEFRMVGSTASIATPNMVLNTIMAAVLDEFADTLEKADNFQAAVDSLIKTTYTAHKRVIFNGDGYADQWLAEAGRRGLPNLVSTVDALPAFSEKKAVDLFERHQVLSNSESGSRLTVYLERYSNQVNLEGRLMIDMFVKDIQPALIAYARELAETDAVIVSAGQSCASLSVKDDLTAIARDLAAAKKACARLSGSLDKAGRYDENQALERAKAFSGAVIPAMNDLRKIVDALEETTPRGIWPFPSYLELLFTL